MAKLPSTPAQPRSAWVRRSPSSFAGQLDTYLFVSKGHVAGKIVDVWRSAFSERVCAYRANRTLGNPVAPAVLIQEMIDADASGMAFSSDPVSGAWGRTVVSAVQGLGTALVNGEIDADTWNVDRQDNVSLVQARKQACHPFDPNSPDSFTVETMRKDFVKGRSSAFAGKRNRSFGEGLRQALRPGAGH